MKKQTFLLITILFSLLFFSCKSKQETLINEGEKFIKEKINDPNLYERISVDIDTVTKKDVIISYCSMFNSVLRVNKLSYLNFAKERIIKEKYKQLSAKYGKLFDTDYFNKTLPGIEYEKLSNLLQDDNLFNTISTDSIKLLNKIIESKHDHYIDQYIDDEFNKIINTQKSIDSLNLIKSTLKYPNEIKYFDLRFKYRAKNKFGGLQIFNSVLSTIDSKQAKFDKYYIDLNNNNY